MHLLQALKPDNYVKRKTFCENIQEACEDDDFQNKPVFSDEAAFHLSGEVNRHNVRIWGTKSLLEIVQQEQDSAKINVFCTVSRNKVYGPFIFDTDYVAGISYLDMLQL